MQLLQDDRRSAPRLLWFAMLAFLPPLLLYAAIVATGYDGLPWMRGDCPYYAATAYSIVHDHDLDLDNQIRKPEGIAHRQVAVDVRGRIVPKHPIWMALAFIPWLVAFGVASGLWFNLCQLVVVLVLAWILARRIAGEAAAALAVCLTGLFSMLPHYAWNMSPDLFTTAAVLFGLVMIGSRRSPVVSHGVAGAAFAIAVTARPTYLLALLPVVFLMRPLRVKTSIAFCAGFAVPALLWMGLNQHLFGGPLITAYDRILVFRDGRPMTFSHRADFDYPIVLGAWQQIVDPIHGLLWSSPVTLISLVGLRRLWRVSRAWAAYVIASGLGLFLLFSCYQEWMTSHAGNRFLMPVAVIAVLPLAALLDGMFRGRDPGPGP